MNGKLLELTVLGRAQPKGSTKAFGYVAGYKDGKPVIKTNTTSMNPNLKDWELEIRVALQRWLVEHPQFKPIGHDVKKAERRPAIAVVSVFYLRPPDGDPKRPWPVVAPDLDKLVRGSLDPLSKRFYMDDSQIVSITTWKLCSDVNHIRMAIFTATERPDVELLMNTNPFQQQHLF